MKRIAITGPESSGKTTLANLLGEKLNGTVFTEYARTYLENLNRDYTKEDLDKICNGHWNQFAQSESEIQIIDTDFIVLKIWSEVAFGSVSLPISDAVDSNHFDLHILCTPDIPWEYDPQREHPNKREELFQLYRMELITSQKKFIEVSGSLEERLEKSLNAIASIQS
ncbi:MAG: ATP-binding protein [Crocinitomicaceae bacterium]|nr:ATP-binding protein [Crocinitomicaceae bacterium]